MDQFGLLVYQFAGESSGRLPAWRLVDVAGISELKLLDNFPGNRPPASTTSGNESSFVSASLEG